jgi:amino acid adenylation domain-containing protein
VSLLSEEKRRLLARRLQQKGIDARHLERASDGPRAVRRRPLPRLSFAQQRLWLLDRLEPGNPFYNINGAAALRGPLDPAVLARAFAEIARRHESLRTTFAERDGIPWQVIAPPQVSDGSLPLADLSALPPETARREAERLAFAAMSTAMDLARGPLVRTSLVRLATEEHLLLVTLHHIISDGWSNNLFLHETAVLYESFAAGKPSPLPELPLHYADFAEQQLEELQGDRLAAEIAWWKEQLAGAPAVLDLPADRPRPPVQTFRGARLPLWIAPDRTEALGRLARRLEKGEEATLFMALLAAFAIVLRSWSGEDDLSIGTPVANRRRPEIEGLIGFFANTLVLRTGLAGDPTVRELLGRVRETAHGAFEHQDLPFEKLVEELHPERDLARSPLFQVMAVLQNAPAARAAASSVGTLDLHRHDLDPGVSRFDLMLDLTELDGGLRGAFEWNTDLFDRPTIQRLAERFHRALGAMIDHPDRRLSELDLLPEAERHQMTVEWGAGAGTSATASVVDLVRAQARRTPDAPAIVGLAGETVSYRELEERANRLARRLLGRGLGRGARVAFSLDRSIELPVVMLGILKSGAAYVPLDPAYPADRLALMLEEARVGAVVKKTPHPRPLSHLPPALSPGEGRDSAQQPPQDLFLQEVSPLPAGGGGEMGEGPGVRCHGSADTPVLDLESLDLGQEDAADPAVALSPDDLAYVLYTSGSTGRPKGVAMRHGALAELLAWQLASTPGRWRTLQYTSPSFDVSFQEIFSTWAAGGALVLISEEARRDPAELLERLRAEGIERLFLPFVALQQLAEAARGVAVPETLREVITAGEQLRVTPAVVDLFTRLPAARLHNHYGPSETHVATAWVLTGDPADWPALPPIGRPVSGGVARVLDADGGAVPLGTPGELLLGGEILARGYLGRPEWTAERFVPDSGGPLPLARGLRLYRTGDLARWRPDGALEFLGRLDGQVKIRGYRVEPGEIEAALEAHPDVASAVVVPREEKPGDRRLIAWVIPAAGREIDPRALRSFLAAKLPDYMVPSSIVSVDALPRTPSGKIDRRALARRSPGTPAETVDFVAPRTPVEETLAAIWSEVLGAEKVSATANFFELGGHSLLGVQVTSRIRGAFGIELPLRALFEDPALEALAARVAADGGLVSPLPAVGRVGDGRGAGGEGLPLSFGQQRIWFVERLDPETAAFNLPVALQLSGRLDAGALTRAFREIVRRHEALHTVFGEEGGEPFQAVRSVASLPPFPLPLIDLSALSAAAGRGEADRWGHHEAGRPFNLARGPLLRALVFRLAPEEHIALTAMHHIVSDGWSLGVLVHEVGVLYGAFVEKKEGSDGLDRSDRSGRSPLPDLPVQYPEYAVWQRNELRGERLEERLRWWREALSGAPQVLELPGDRPRPAVFSQRGAQRAVALPGGLTAALRALARREEATLFMTLLAGLATVLGRWSGAEDLLVAAPVAGRTRPELEAMIGFFVNDLPLRCDLTGGPPFRDLLRRVRTTALGAFAHQDLPFDRLVEEVLEVRSLSHHALCQVAFAFQNIPMGSLALPGLALTPLPVASGTAKLDLLLSIGEDGASGPVAGIWEYSTDLFDEATIDRFAGHFMTLLAAAAAEPGQPLSELPLLTAEERQQIAAWNRTGAGESGDGLLPSLVRPWVERTPHAPAVLQDGRMLTYAALWAAAVRLARRLVALGAGPESRIAICLDETVERVVAVLGVVLAGGAWVPLDPAYPRERLAWMLEDSAAPVVLTREGLRAALPELDAIPGAKVVCLDGPEGEAEPEAADLPRLDPDGLAYVLYTSGSTGRPNGVMIRHRSAAGLVRSMLGIVGVRPGERMLQVISFSFDASVEEMWMGLAGGATLCIAPREARLSGEVLAAEIRRYESVYLCAVPALLAQLPDGDDPTLRVVTVGGESCPPDLVHRWAGRLRLINCYGPTETTVNVSTYLCTGAERREPPIGRPLPGNRFWVLDRRFRPLPVGVPGALWIAGASLARGYQNRPDLTAERFVPDPFSSEPGTRLYRTGDLVRLLPDGNLEFLGRIDQQVKIRGVRVELGEIEAALLADPAVEECAVVVRESDRGEKSLVAFFGRRPERHPEGEGRAGRIWEGGAFLPPDPLGRQGSPQDDISKPASEESNLRAALRRRLPEAMIPAVIVRLDALPRTPVGKIDRKALERQARASVSPEGAVPVRPPATPTERTLAGLWSDLLGIPEASGIGGIGAGDSFFDRGGHSLLATRLVSRIRQQWGIELPLLAVFETPVLEGLAQRIDAARQAGGAPVRPPLAAAGPPVQPGATRRAPLSFAQRRLWFLDQLEPGLAAYNIPAAVRFTGALDIAALAGSLDAIAARHETLRTTFESVQGEPAQVISGPGANAGLPLPVADLSALPAERRTAEAARLGRLAALLPFDLARGPLVRALLVRHTPEEHDLVAVMHHIVSDGWSTGVMIGELGELYAASREARPAALPPLPIQYADYAVWQNGWLRGEALDALLAWWRRELDGAPHILDLPTDRPRPPVQTFRGAGEPFMLPADLTAALGGLGRREGATPFMLLLAGLEAVLGRWAGQDDLLIGAPVANRTRGETEPLIGFFVNTLVHRGRLGGDPSFRDLVGRVRASALGAFDRQDLPFERLVEALGVERTRNRTPLYQVLFALQNAPAGALHLPGLVLAEIPLGTESAKTDLLLSLAEIPGSGEPAGLRGLWEYAADLFDAATIRRLGRSLATFLQAAAASPGTPVPELPLLAAEESRELLVDRNRTAAAFPRDASLGDLFAETAARTPGAVAVSSEAGDLTYKDLEDRSARIARSLLDLGISPEERIGIIAERSPGLIAALLGIVRAGAAYLPLDPTYPPERLAWMLHDAGARLLLADRRLLEILPPGMLPGDLRIVPIEEALEPHPRPLSHRPPVPRERGATAQEHSKSGLPSPPSPGGRGGDGRGGQGGEALAYVMYTSGSTGTPKGVAASHRNVIRLVRGSRFAAMGPEQTWLQLAPVSFDASTLEIWSPLLNGGRLALAPAGRLSLDDLGHAIERHGVTSLWLTAGLFHQMADHRLAALRPLRQLLAGGDVVSPVQVRRVLEALPDLTLINGYGPTEGTTFTCCHVMTSPRQMSSSVPIGTPIANARVYVLDAAQQPVPAGVAGELYLGGDGLARGYLGRPELTAERFLPDPFGALAGTSGERLYRTGDRVRWITVEGRDALEFLGREAGDGQVKIRGHRVEIGEVEAALTALPGIRSAAVTVRQTVHQDAVAGKALTAYVVPVEPAPADLVLELQRALRGRLPDPLIPTAWVVLAALPLTPNGKVDRRALPEPEGGAQRGGYLAPRSPLEEKIVEICADILAVDKDRISVRDNFFALGGHSLLATQLAVRLHDHLHLEVPLRLVFDTPDLMTLAERITDQELAATDAEDLSALLDEIEDLTPEERQALLAGDEVDQR